MSGTLHLYKQQEELYPNGKENSLEEPVLVSPTLFSEDRSKLPIGMKIYGEESQVAIEVAICRRRTERRLRCRGKKSQSSQQRPEGVQDTENHYVATNSRWDLQTVGYFVALQQIKPIIGNHPQPLSKSVKSNSDGRFNGQTGGCQFRTIIDSGCSLSFAIETVESNPEVMDYSVVDGPQPLSNLVLHQNEQEKRDFHRSSESFHKINEIAEVLIPKDKLVINTETGRFLSENLQKVKEVEVKEVSVAEVEVVEVIEVQEDVIGYAQDLKISSDEPDLLVKEELKRISKISEKSDEVLATIALSNNGKMNEEVTDKGTEPDLVPKWNSVMEDIIDMEDEEMMPIQILGKTANMPLRNLDYSDDIHPDLPDDDVSKKDDFDNVEEVRMDFKTSKSNFSKKVANHYAEESSVHNENKDLVEDDIKISEQSNNQKDSTNPKEKAVPLQNSDTSSNEKLKTSPPLLPTTLKTVPSSTSQTVLENEVKTSPPILPTTLKTVPSLTKPIVLENEVKTTQLPPKLTSTTDTSSLRLHKASDSRANNEEQASNTTPPPRNTVSLTNIQFDKIPVRQSSKENPGKGLGKPDMLSLLERMSARKNIIDLVKKGKDATKEDPPRDIRDDLSYYDKNVPNDPPKICKRNDSRMNQSSLRMGEEYEEPIHFTADGGFAHKIHTVFSCSWSLPDPREMN